MINRISAAITKLSGLRLVLFIAFAAFAAFGVTKLIFRLPMPVSGGQVPDTLQTFDAGGGQVQIRAATAGTSLSISGGSIGGALDTRDGALTRLRDGLDALASQLITSVNAVYTTGYDLNGGATGAFRGHPAHSLA